MNDPLNVKYKINLYKMFKSRGIPYNKYNWHCGGPYCKVYVMLAC